MRLATSEEWTIFKKKRYKVYTTNSFSESVISAVFVIVVVDVVIIIFERAFMAAIIDDIGFTLDMLYEVKP